MSIERKVRAVAIALCVLCLAAATGLGLGNWTLAGTEKFEAPRPPAYARDRSNGTAFWEAQGMATRPAPAMPPAATAGNETAPPIAPDAREPDAF